MTTKETLKAGIKQCNAGWCGKALVFFTQALAQLEAPPKEQTYFVCVRCGKIDPCFIVECQECKNKTLQAPAGNVVGKCYTARSVGEFTKKAREYLDKDSEGPHYLQDWLRDWCLEACTRLGSQNEDITAFQEDLLVANKKLDRLEAELKKLNLILYHRENGLAHPDLQGEIGKSKLAEENKLLKETIGLAIDGIDALNLMTDKTPTYEDFEAIKQTLEQVK